MDGVTKLLSYDSVLHRLDGWSAPSGQTVIGVSPKLNLM